MQLVAVCDALDRADLAAPGLGAQHQARAHDTAVERAGTGAAVAGAAAFLAAGESEPVAQHVEQRLVDLAEVRDGVAVDCGGDLDLGHQFPLARLSAISAARRASTPATLVRNSLVPRLSSIGRQAAEVAAARRSSAFASTVLPISALAASGTRITRSATAPSATRAAVQTPFVSSVRLTPTPTTAMSISDRGMKRRYASPERCGRFGSRIASTISPRLSEVLPGPVPTLSTGTMRLPRGPAITAEAPAATSAGTLSAAGEALQRLPASVARDWIWCEPMRFAASTTPGHALRSALCSPSSAPATAAPIRNVPALAVMVRSAGIRFTWTRRSVPPARMRALALAASNFTAALTVVGASNRMRLFWGCRGSTRPDPTA